MCICMRDRKPHENMHLIFSCHKIPIKSIMNVLTNQVFIHQFNYFSLFHGYLASNKYMSQRIHLPLTAFDQWP